MRRTDVGEPLDRAPAFIASAQSDAFRQRLEELRERQTALDNARHANAIAWNKLQQEISHEIAQLKSEMDGVSIQ